MAVERPIRLMLVDDHSVVRMGLSAILSLDKGLRVVSEAEDGEQAVEQYRKSRPDVALMDVQMPKMGGVEGLRAILAEWPEARVIMLTTSDLDDDIHRALEAGASGYLLKNVSRCELVGAIREVHAGRNYVPTAIRHRLDELEKRRQLSAREIEVLDGMRRGLTNKDIALSLSLSEHTVKAHVKSVLSKLESADRAEAVARGFELGLLRVGRR
jgi:two-component system NarL family response regulator